jgi:hypothetical protein
MNRHYILVNSGLSWWTPPKNTSDQTGYAFQGSKVEILNKFQDFILFRESPDNIVSEGLFDNNWKMPAAAIETLKSTGAVTVNQQ